MGASERMVLYQNIEKMRDRPLISYVTSIRQNASSQMAGDAIPCIIEQVKQIPAENEDVDFLIISNGGDPITALRIISILRERFKKISVLVPYVAYSAATVLALGADDIIMHPFSNLGPVDPQITIAKSDALGQQSHINFGSEDIRNYIDFIKTDVGITDQAHLMSAFNALAAEVGPLPIGSSKRSQQLSVSLSIRLLETHMQDTNKAKTIAQALNSAYYHHGYAVGRSEAKEIGLNVIDPDKQIEAALWAVWEDFSEEMKCNSEFNPIAEIMNNPEARSKIFNIPILELPLNTPPEMVMNAFAQLLQQGFQVSQQTPIEILLPVAAIESIRLAHRVTTAFNVVYWRDPNMSLSVNVTSYSNGWERVCQQEVSK
ncbi:MAG: hypothetical protein LBP28_08975 [Coriobacteriales bacterium]|jgi:hypothetical protein|nr:hypothetical protein [Coriobacteriales bacterium]